MRRKNLTEAGSTQTPAYLTLIDLGYKVYREVNFDSRYEMWYAESDEIRLSADDVVKLLGLHTLWVHRKDTGWQASNAETHRFIEKFPMVDYENRGYFR